jgi:hypothetical protein
MNKIIKDSNTVYLDVIGRDNTYRVKISKIQAELLMNQAQTDMEIIDIGNGDILITAGS